MYGLPKLEPIYLIKNKLEVEASALSKKEYKEKNEWLGRKSLGSFFKTANYLTTIPKLGIGLFKGSKSIGT